MSIIFDVLLDMCPRIVLYNVYACIQGIHTIYSMHLYTVQRKHCVVNTKHILYSTYYIYSIYSTQYTVYTIHIEYKIHIIYIYIYIHMVPTWNFKNVNESAVKL